VARTCDFDTPGLTLKCYIGSRTKSGLGARPVFRVHVQTVSQFSRRPFAMMGAFRWGWLCCLAVFAAANIALPANARAGCTHPWVQPTGAARSLADLALLSLNDRPADIERGIPTPARRPGPCAGGACSQPSGFPPLSTSQIPSRSELWGELALESPPLVPLAGRLCLEPGIDRPRRSPAPIERPPRRLFVG